MVLPDSVGGVSAPGAADDDATLAVSGAPSEGSETGGETSDRMPLVSSVGDSIRGDISMRLQCSAVGWFSSSRPLDCANK